ncbi:MAG: LamG-like jellyroll fold domain-containing protein [Rhizomicrobium sp.]
MNLKYGLSLRPYGNSSDTYLDKVTVLYGFEDTDLSSGVNNEGSLADGTVTDSGVAVTTSAHYAGSQCAAFNQNGTNKGILVGTVADVLGSGDYTVEGWIKDPGGNRFMIFSSGTSNSSRFNLLGTAKLGIALTEAAAVEPASDANVWTADEWFHFAFVYVASTTTWCAYVDGTLVLSKTYTAPSSGNVYLGQDFASDTIAGPEYLDEVRITKVARYSGASFAVPDAPFPRSGS